MLALAVSINAFSTHARAAPPRVVASIGPVHSLVAGVMAGVGEPALLVRSGASPHTYQMRPSEAASLRDAELVFWVGPTLETFLRRSIESLGRDAGVVTLMTLPGLELLENRPPGARHGGQASPAHVHADALAGHGRLDPHIWLSPGNAVVMVGAIERALKRADPMNAGRYADNTARLAARLAALQQRMTEALDTVRDVPFVVFHDGYQYLEHAFGLRSVGALTLTPLGMTSARRLVSLRDLIVSLGARCVFREPQFEPALVATLVEGTGARIGILDPLGIGISPGADAYFELMQTNTRSLLECLSP